MNDNYILHDGQLYHHGIKGMKWGVRRFQRQDGSLTPAGQKRYNDGNGDGGGWKAKIEARRKKRAQEKIDNAYRKKRVEDMTPEELEAANKRAKLEREHRAIRPDTWKTESEAKAEAKAKKVQDKAEAEAEAKKINNQTGKQIHKKSVEDMTTEELATAIERARLEDAYRSLRPTEMTKGQKFVESVKGIATKIAEEEGKNFVSKLGDKLLEKYFPKAADTLSDLKTKADIDKVKADAEKVRAEAEKIRNEASNKADTTLDDLKKRAEIKKTNAEAAKAAQEARKTKIENDTNTPKAKIKTEESNSNANTKVTSAGTSGNKTADSNSNPPKKETYYADVIYDKPSSKTKSVPSSTKTYDVIEVTDFVDKSANKSTSVVVRDSSDITTGKRYASDCSDLTVSELIRKQWDN